MLVLPFFVEGMTHAKARRGTAQGFSPLQVDNAAADGESEHHSLRLGAFA